MPVATRRAESAEARAYEALMAHAHSCKLCRARGQDLCRTYLRLFSKWEKAQRAQ